MKKNGFVLVETLIATALLATIFTILYMQFININDKYKSSYTNNSVDNMYGINNIKSYILSNGYNNLVPLENYVDITLCPSLYFTNTTQCENLLNVLEINQVLFSNDNMSQIKNYMLNDISISDNFKKFIKRFNTPTIENGYRILVEFNDGDCATIRM